MPQMTPAQVKAHEKPIKSATKKDADPEPISAEKMLAVGTDVTIGNPIELPASIGARTYAIAAFPLVAQPRATKLLMMVPELLRTHAIAAALAGTDYDIVATADLMRRLSSTGTKSQSHIMGTVRAVVDAINEVREADGLDMVPYPDNVALPDADSSELTPEMLEITLMGGVEYSEDETAAMVDLVHLSVLRRQSSVTRDDIEAELDLPSFMDALRIIYTLNDGLRTRFTKLQRA